MVELSGVVIAAMSLKREVVPYASTITFSTIDGLALPVWTVSNSWRTCATALPIASFVCVNAEFMSIFSLSFLFANDWTRTQSAPAPIGN